MAATSRRRIAVLAGMATLLAAPAASANPLFMDTGAADPGVFTRGDGFYHVVATAHFSKPAGGAISWRGTNDPAFATWGNFGRVLKAQPGWVLTGKATRKTNKHGKRTGYWAPDMAALPDGRLAVYFAAWANTTYRGNPASPDSKHPPEPVRCIGRASAGADGRWVADPYPVVCNHRKTKRGKPNAYNLIDAQMFTDIHGAQYLLYKREDTNQIMIRTIGADGLTALGPPRVALGPSQAWESGNTEAPNLVYNGGDNLYYLFYSGGRFNKDSYGVGVARSTSPIGPFKKVKQRPRWATGAPNGSRAGNPILAGRFDGTFCGVGGQDVTWTPRDNWILWYHAYTQQSASGACSGQRFLMKETMTFDLNGGWPRVSNGLPSH